MRKQSDGNRARRVQRTCSRRTPHPTTCSKNSGNSKSAQAPNPIDAAISKLNSISGIVNVRLVGNPEKSMLLRIEEEACAATGFAGLEFVNEGVKLVLEREVVIAINHSSSLRHPSKPLLVITQDDCAVGHEVWEQCQVKRFETDRNAVLLGSSLVLFRDKLRAARGKKLKVVLGPQDFPELETVHGVCDVRSATISRTTDIYIKKMAGWDTTRPDSGTVLVGFNSRPQRTHTILQSFWPG